MFDALRFAANSFNRTDALRFAPEERYVYSIHNKHR